MGSDEESTLFGSAGFMKDRILLTVENDLFGQKVQILPEKNPP